MLWGAIDPYEYPGERLAEIKSLVSSTQHRKAMICQRAIVEAVCAGTLPFSRAFETHSDYNGEWEKEIDFPDTPDPDKVLPHKTRITQAAFFKWAKNKNLESYRAVVMRSLNKMQPNQAETVSYIESGSSNVPLLEAPVPTYMDPANVLSSIETRAVHDTWHAVTKNGTHDPRQLGISVRTATFEYLDNHPEYKKFSNQAKERIFGVINWDKKGGAPRTPANLANH